MIVPVDATNLYEAATIHSISWKESHRAFCDCDFIEMHTPERQWEYILPEMQNKGYGTKLMQFAISRCADTPVLWILENNEGARRLYHRMGFTETGRRNPITNQLDEIEMQLHHPVKGIEA